jgi:hypothetical protein
VDHSVDKAGIPDNEPALLLVADRSAVAGLAAVEDIDNELLVDEIHLKRTAAPVATAVAADVAVVVDLACCMDLKVQRDQVEWAFADVVVVEVHLSMAGLLVAERFGLDNYPLDMEVGLGRVQLLEVGLDSLVQ